MNTDYKRNVVAMLIDLVISIVLVILLDSAFGWANNIWVRKSNFFQNPMMSMALAGLSGIRAS